MTDNIKISQWRGGKEVLLPSGNKPTLRRINMLSVASGGTDCPDFLTTIVRTGFKGENPQIDRDPESLAALDVSLNWLCMQCFIDPKVGPVAAPNCLGFHEIDLTDKMAVFAFAMGKEGASAQAFLQGQDSSVESAPFSEDLQPAPQSDIQTEE